MKRLFYDTEQDIYITEYEIMDIWKAYSASEKENYNNNFEDFLKCCMISENGNLQAIVEKEEELTREFNKYYINPYTVDNIINISLELKRLYDFREENE